MFVRFWGVRAQVATPGSQYIRFGGNTPCIEIRNSAGELLILDAGTGLPPLGGFLMGTGAVKPGVTIKLLLSDTRWDHTQGFPFFVPCYIPGVNIEWHGPAEEDENLRQVISGAMQYSYFPIRLDELRSTQRFFKADGKELSLNGFEISSMAVNTEHRSLAYKIKSDNRTLVHVPGYEEGDAAFNKKLEDFARGADVLIHDAYYQDSSQYKAGWGRASLSTGIELCARLGITEMIATGYRPGEADETLEKVTRAMISDLDIRQVPVDVRLAREGMSARV